MKKEQPRKMQATTTRNVLSFMLVLVIIVAAVGFYFGLQFVKEYALEVSQTVTLSKANDKKPVGQNQLKQELADSQGLVAKTSLLFSTPSTYQAQVLKDITKYADEAGITVSGVDSVKPNTESSKTIPSDGGQSETISIKNPVSYTALLNFLHAIEGNLPKMQVTNITISRPAAPSGDMVSVDNITLTVATK